MTKDTRKEFSIYLSKAEKELIEDAAYMVRKKPAVWAREILTGVARAVVEVGSDAPPQIKEMSK